MQLHKDQSAGSGSGKYTTPEENRELMVEPLRKTVPQVGTSDPSEVTKVRQRPQKPWIDRVPSAAEIAAARKNPGAAKFGGDKKCPGKFGRVRQKE